VAVGLPDPKVPGFQFPESEATILTWVHAMGSGSPEAAAASNNVILHGWGLWTALTLETSQIDNGDPLRVFETWYTPQEIDPQPTVNGQAAAPVAAALLAPRHRAALRNFAQFEHGLEPRDRELLAQASGSETVFGYVKFDPTAAAHVAAQQLLSAASLNALLDGGAQQVPVFPQTALTLNLAHDRPHRSGATEFHTEHGPLTLVPLPGARSSVVCVLSPNDADALSRMNDNELSAEIERRAHSLLGKMRAEPGRGLFPLATETAHAFARARIALVGEAAHVVPPIGAQGLNLGLRDAATLAEIVADARRQGADLGATAILARYDRARRADAMSRRIAVDLLNRSLLTDFLPVQSVRGLSLFLVDRVGSLRRALMREGVAPRAAQPRLMRGEPV